MGLLPARTPDSLLYNQARRPVAPGKALGADFISDGRTACRLLLQVPNPAVRLPSACPALSSLPGYACMARRQRRPGPVCACRCVFAFARKAATYRSPRAAASWAASWYSPGTPFRVGAVSWFTHMAQWRSNAQCAMRRAVCVMAHSHGAMRAA
jgi:hypothetical protein